MLHESIHVIFAGGGTGGHLFPGLAVAERLLAAMPSARITFCGGGKPWEEQSAAAAGHGYFTLSARPWPRSVGQAARFIASNLSGYLAAKRFIEREHAAVVVGLGGFASAPMARAAVACGVPLVMLEQNAVAGRVTRWLCRRAALVCTSFAQTQSLPPCKVRVTGNPVRREFFHRLPSPRPLRCARRGAGGEGDLHATSSALTLTLSQRERGPTLLILGGSGGARWLNENVPTALMQVADELRGWRIVHQCGRGNEAAVQALYRNLSMPAETTPFIERMPAVLAQTSLVVCRAGGTTLAELAAVGAPAVVVPYPLSADGHQAANARCFAAAGGCVTIEQPSSPDRTQSAARLAEAIRPLLADAALRERMSAAMRGLARPNAVDEVAEAICSLIAARHVVRAA